MADKKFIAGAIKRPGRLTAAAKAAGRTVDEQAHFWAMHGDTSQKQAANLYLKVLKR